MNKKQPLTHPVGARLPPDVLSALKEESVATERSLSWLIAKICADWSDARSAKKTAKS